MLATLLQAAGDKADAGWATDVILIWAAIIGAGLIALFLVLAAPMIILGVLRRRQLARSGVEDIDKMSGRVFEQYLQVAFTRLGYRVERTRFAGDYGGDLVLSKDGTRTVVQAKRYAKNVGVQAVQEAVAAKGAYDCSAAMVVSNSFYTQQAQHLARKNSVELWDRDRLAAVLIKTDAKSAHEQAVVGEPVATAVAGGQSSANRPGDADEPIATVESCATCAKVLTAAERTYCERNADRFGGRMLCYRHQRKTR